mmetsp:Transcript_22031/g.32836  ORF Transcript_22031/g.32836 Transcript_22031/m.32836 type:complete len:182 (-) Transcript_22031:204-749(-)
MVNCQRYLTLAFWVHSCRISLLPVWWLTIWYLYILSFYGSADPKMWGSAVGIAIIIGCTLFSNMYYAPFDKFMEKNDWVVIRVFIIPFCVSSYSQVIQKKEDEFAFIFPRDAGIALGGIVFASVITGSLYAFRRVAIMKGWYVAKGIDAVDAKGNPPPRKLDELGDGDTINETKNAEHAEV